LDRWRFDYLDDTSNQVEAELLASCDALLMGRRTYESFAAAWPDRGGEIAEATKLKQQPGGDILTYGFRPVVRSGEASNLLFHQGKSARMRLLDSRTLPSGVVVLAYRPAGDDGSEAAS
jgi:hypothetical protein